jgi:EAL domain-containing protein (putative c-di-GMP-specific phosphodiesterase class I)
LELHYQPIVAAQGGRIVGVEALLRWTHATRGPIGPAVFIPVAEQMGLMDSLGAFVLRRALKEAKRWPDLYVAVNLSPLQVRDRAIVDLVRSALAESGMPPSRLMLEITEGVLIDNPEEMVKRIEDLHALGVSIALDDFGSGYSSLGYLQRFPLDKLKIDRSFVVALGESANGGVIIQAIVALGRALGLSVLVEGVETEQQRVLLRLAGCDEMQGFLFARPAPAKTIDRLLAQAKRSARAPMPPEALTA